MDSTMVITFEHLWAELGAVTLAAFGLTIRLAHIATSLKNANDNISSLRSEIDFTKKKHDEALIAINNRNQESLKKITEELNHFKKSRHQEPYKAKVHIEPFKL